MDYTPPFYKNQIIVYNKLAIKLRYIADFRIMQFIELHDWRIYVRIDKFLANSGYGSRKDVKAVIRKGRVFIGGEAVARPERKIDPERDEVYVDGEKVEYVKFAYFMMNKPAGVISASYDPHGVEECAAGLLPEEYAWHGVYPVGRLDKDATGLLLFTNDGIFAHRATSPKKNAKKVYYAEVYGELSESDVSAFAAGVKLDDGYVCRSAGLEIIGEGPVSSARVVITEGKYHQVKRMFAALGKHVTLLKRISFCGIDLPEDLAEGESRPLNSEEMRLISPYVSDGSKDTENGD